MTTTNECPYCTKDCPTKQHPKDTPCPTCACEGRKDIELASSAARSWTLVITPQLKKALKILRPNEVARVLK
jgi:hypothetical protein